jgi:predicted peptidase
MGGMGTWSLGMARPDLFAALVPIAGGIYSPPMSSDVTPLVRIPVWAFHDRADPSIPLARDLAPIGRLQALGGTARLTITETGMHYIHPAVYADPVLLEWLHAQLKSPSR